MLFGSQSEAEQKIREQIKQVVIRRVEIQVELNETQKHELNHLIDEELTRVFTGFDQASIEKLNELLTHQQRKLASYEEQLKAATKQGEEEDYSYEWPEQEREGRSFDW